MLILHPRLLILHTPVLIPHLIIPHRLKFACELQFTCGLIPRELILRMLILHMLIPSPFT